MKPEKHSFRRYLAVLLCFVLMMSNISVAAYADGTDSAPDDEISIDQENTLPESENDDSSDSGSLDEEDADPSADQSPEEEEPAKDAEKEPAKDTSDGQTDTETAGEKSTETTGSDKSGTESGEEAAVTEEGRAAPGEGTVSSVSFVERSWNGTAVVSETKNIDAAAVPSDGSMTGGWYYLNSDVSRDSRVESITGDVNLILGDGHTLDVKGLYVPAGITFTITDGTDTYTVTASPLSYGYTSVKNGDEARRNLGKALYLYNQAADAYFGS